VTFITQSIIHIFTKVGRLRTSRFLGSENCCLTEESEVVHNTAISAVYTAVSHDQVDGSLHLDMSADLIQGPKTSFFRLTVYHRDNYSPNDFNIC
jgi:hypothetical protein